MCRIMPSRLHGCGLFCVRQYIPYQHVLTLDINYVRPPVCDDYYGRYMNHSYSPNCVVDGYYVKASRVIKPFEEPDYSRLKLETKVGWS